VTPRSSLWEPVAAEAGVEHDADSESDDRPVFTIDLAAIVENWRQLARRADPAEAAATVKADAYGLGMTRVAPALAAAGARTFFVATLEEGIALRTLLATERIYVLNGVWPAGAQEMLRRELRPCLNSLEQISIWQARGAGRPAALHIDTGINRLGLGPDEVEVLTEEPGRLAGIEFSLVMSHLACADESTHPLNRIQLERFRERTAALGLGGRVRSIAASSGIFLGPDFHFDLVRPGAALYGLASLTNHPNFMSQAVRLEGKIIQTRHVDRGMTVGYGATNSIEGPGRIAIVGLGYADGFPRSLGNRGYAVLGGERIPVVGRVSMDLIALDVSATPPERSLPGAMVELIGPNHSIEELASEAGTNGYEMLTALGRRYRRVYREPDSGGAAQPIK
jgi:alanine racemase